LRKKLREEYNLGMLREEEEKQIWDVEY